eukprot:gene6526-7194_t
MEVNTDTKTRLEIIERNARSKVAAAHNTVIVRDIKYLKRNVTVPHEPVFIAATEDLGTIRVRANHLDSVLDYFVEQEKLKKAGALM